MTRLMLIALMILGGTALVSLPAQAQEEGTLKAFAAWQGRGQIYETGPDRATFVGSFSGMIFVETEKGPLDAGFMVCPAFLDVNVKDGTQEGKGRCTISAKDGSRAYAELQCKGVHLVGCDGDFKFTGGTERFEGLTGGGPITIRSGIQDFALTGGTERFEGLTGGGPITIRSGIQDFALAGGNTVQESAGGIIIWPKLTYKLAKASQ